MEKCLVGLRNSTNMEFKVIMKMKKREQFNHFIEDLGRCSKCERLQKRNGKGCSLINIYRDFNFCTKIPSVWTDWYRRLDADIMIIG